jgi:hypothetical protein
VTPGYRITATATDPANNTSEFSACAAVLPFPPSPFLNVSFSAGQLTFSWTNSATCFALQETESLSPPIQWAAVTNAPIATNGQFLVTLPLPAGNHFYQLFSPCAAPPPSPLLEISSSPDDQISLAWALAAAGFVVQETESLSSPIQWATLTNAPVINGDRFVVTLPRHAGNRFYRLSFEQARP